MTRSALVYLASRLLAVAAVTALVVVAGGSLYVAGVVAGGLLVVMAVARGRGRYVGTASGAVLHRDERGREIADRAARNGFIVVVLFLAGISFVSHAIGRSAVALPLVELALTAGALAWLGSDLWQRRG